MVIHGTPHFLGLFEKRVEGDDSLLELARYYFKKAGLGTEFYVDSPAALTHLLTFKPATETVVMIHLAREIDLLNESDIEFIIHMARQFSERILGLVIHDRKEMCTRRGDYLKVLQKLNARLGEMPGRPFLFIEYAAGLNINFFIDLFETIRDLDHISACIDIGHIGLQQTRLIYSGEFINEDVCALSPADRTRSGVGLFAAACGVSIVTMMLER